MASSYTSNSGIEKPAEGDQTGEWGDTVNTNMDIIDRSINGVGAITLSGTTHTLTTTDGTLSDGMYKVLVLGGSPSGTNTITIAPNDADKVYIVVNGSGQTATFTQGSGGNVSVLNGDSKIIYADGAGSGAAVVDITANLSFSSVNIDGGTIDGTVIGGASAAAGTFTTVTASGEIDGASLDISGNADIDGTLETDALSIASTTVTSTAAELNYNDTGAAVGTVVASKTVTADANKDVASFRNITLTGELDAGSLDISGDADIDGTLETDALSIASTAVTSTAAELNYLDITTLGTSEASKAVTVDSSGDLIVPDSDKFKFGAGSDMQLYHDGTNSYITNGTGILKIATETSGIALTIGHTTSEVTFGDNVTITGDFTVNGTTTTINTTNLTVTDPLVKYGQGYTGTAYDEGFIITRGNGSATNTANKGFIWDESADEFAAIACNTEDGTTAGNVTINSYADLQVDKLTGGSLDISGDVDVDGTLEADAMTLNGTAITATATLSTGISNTNVPVFTSGVADDDFLRVAGTSIEGRSAAEVLSDIGASAVAGSSSIVTTGALNSGSITSGFGSIDNGSSAITTTGVITGGTVEATTDTAAGDNAAVGYTSAEGLILTGQGSTSDVTFKNDADTTVFSIPTGTADVLFPDGARALFGAGSDLQISHDGSNSYIDENGDGQLNIRTVNGASINLISGSEFMVQSESDGAVTLYHNGASKIATHASGALMTTTSELQFYTTAYGIRASTGLEIKTGDFTRFLKGTSEYMRIIDGGKVGIGTTAPSAMLQVHSAALGTTAGNSQDILQLHSPDTNNNTIYRFHTFRTANGDSHNSSEGRFQRKVDVTEQGYIGFRADNITFGYGTTERMRIVQDGKVGIGATANLTGYVNLPESDYGEGFNWFSSGTAANRGGIGHYAYESRIYYGASDNLTFVDGGPSGTERMRIDADGNVIVKKTAAGGVTLGADKDTSNTSDTFLTIEGTSETHGSAVIQKGLAGNTTFYQNVAYYASTTTTQEVSRITGSGTNGFMMLVRVHTCGHTSSIGDGYDIKYYTWSGGSSTPTQVYSLGGGGNNPDITVTVPSANVLVVNVSAANTAGIYTYRGAVQIEYLVPNDFVNSTWVVS